MHIDCGHCTRWRDRGSGSSTAGRRASAPTATAPARSNSPTKRKRSWRTSSSPVPARSRRAKRPADRGNVAGGSGHPDAGDRPPEHERDVLRRRGQAGLRRRSQHQPDAAPGTVAVSSGTDDDTYYEVTLDTCSCIGGPQIGRCYHRAFYLWLLWCQECDRRRRRRPHPRTDRRLGRRGSGRPGRSPSPPEGCHTMQPIVVTVIIGAKKLTVGTYADPVVAEAVAAAGRSGAAAGPRS